MRASHQTEDSGFCGLARLVLGIIAFTCVVITAEGQGSSNEKVGEEGYAATEDSVPPGEASWIVFTLNAQAEIRFDYKVESGREVDLYIMTRAQFDRARGGTEPTQAGKDFIRHVRAITGQGSQVENLRPGKYGVVFRNRSNKPVRVWTHSTAIRN